MVLCFSNLAIFCFFLFSMNPSKWKQKSVTYNRCRASFLDSRLFHPYSHSTNGIVCGKISIKIGNNLATDGRVLNCGFNLPFTENYSTLLLYFCQWTVKDHFYIKFSWILLIYFCLMKMPTNQNFETFSFCCLCKLRIKLSVLLLSYLWIKFNLFLLQSDVIDGNCNFKYIQNIFKIMCCHEKRIKIPMNN